MSLGIEYTYSFKVEGSTHQADDIRKDTELFQIDAQGLIAVAWLLNSWLKLYVTLCFLKYRHLQLNQVSINELVQPI